EIDSVPNPEQLQNFQNFVNEQLDLDRAVAVHCSTGKHRTGTMIAAYLIQTGTFYESAMNIIYSANPNIHLPDSQITFLQSL
ncbi:dual specificity protein phosphatase family protein, partial [Cyanobacteria bacterium FACHB-63]|nr:dual specificity protein phosphatase family protein [Cyanobacteria bacterium FACHB-63]